jgi:hypothetical protein
MPKALADLFEYHASLGDSNPVNLVIMRDIFYKLKENGEYKLLCEVLRPQKVLTQRGIRKTIGEPIIYNTIN